jgi:predicted nucleic acid-binding protein
LDNFISGVAQIQTPSAIGQSITLGLGEQEAISLAKEIHADLILLDDRKARKIANEQNLNIAGTLNILKSASNRGMVELNDVLQKLGNTNFRISPALVLELLKEN